MEIRVKELTKRFKDVVAVDGVTFSFPESHVTCLLGPSGCGKTTLMRIIAGLEKPTSGDVYFGPNRVTNLPPRKRNIGMVFQYPVVYRGISVYQNIELPLKSDKLSKQERSARVDEVIALLGLEAAADRDITQLDNGTRQKVAVAREIARQPRIILFDEPITNVDTEAKLQLKRAFKELTRRLQQTIIYVTHDQTEAMTLADTIALMQDGRIVQADHPRTLYNQPADTFAGWFLGNPGMNFLPATITVTPEGATQIHSPLFPLAIDISGTDLTYSAVPSDEIRLGIRPEHIQVLAEPSPLAVEGRLKSKAISIGGQYLLTLEVAGQTIKAKVAAEHGSYLEPRTDVWISLPLDRITLFNTTGCRLDATLSVPSSTADAPAPLTQ